MFALNRSWLVLAFMVSFAATADADIFALFSDDGGTTFSNSYTVTTGSTLTVDVFLGQDGANTQLSDSGLFSLGLAATSQSSASGSITSATPNPVFDFVTTDQFNANSLEWEAAALNNAIPTGNQILLGSFNLTTVADGVTTISFGDTQPGTGAPNASWVTDDGELLDEIIFGAGATEDYLLMIEAVAAVPEPAVGALLGLLCVGFATRRFR